MITADELNSLLADIESDRVEMTRSLTNMDKFGEAICSFSNDLPRHGKPGYLVIGIDDKTRTPCGAEITDQLLQMLGSFRDSGQITPLPSLTVSKFQRDTFDVAVVEVFPSPMPPVRYKGRVHVRIGPRRAVATIAEERRLSEKRVDHARTWDAQACLGATLDDLALDLFKLNYLPKAVSRDTLETNGRSIEEQLAACRFFSPKLGLPTNASVLLFGSDPLSFVPGAYVQFVSYSGSSAATSVVNEREFSGDLLGVMRELDRLASDIAQTRPVRQSNLTDSPVHDYPPLALHELFMNSIIHRNYDSSTTPISISFYDDRLEILNPGSLYGDLTADMFADRGTSYRNPILAEAAKTLGYVNRFGRGIAIVQDELAKNGSPPAEFHPKENHFHVAVRRRT